MIRVRAVGPFHETPCIPRPYVVVPDLFLSFSKIRADVLFHVTLAHPQNPGSGSPFAIRLRRSGALFRDTIQSLWIAMKE